MLSSELNSVGVGPQTDKLGHRDLGIKFKNKKRKKNQLLLNTIFNGQSLKNSRIHGSDFLYRTLGCKNVGGFVLRKILSFMKSQIFMK